MHRPEFPEITFTALMVLAMALPISLYNQLLAVGKLDATSVMQLLKGLWIPYLFAFSIELILIKPATQALAGKLIPQNGHKVIRILIFGGLMVTMMCSTMTGFITLITNHQLPFFRHWLQLFCFTYPFALFWQLLIAGPLIRRIHKLMHQSATSKS